MRVYSAVAQSDYLYRGALIFSTEIIFACELIVNAFLIVSLVATSSWNLYLAIWRLNYTYHTSPDAYVEAEVTVIHGWVTTINFWQ